MTRFWCGGILLLMLTGCLGNGDTRPFPPFSESQFGSESVPVMAINPHLYADIRVRILPPEDARSTRYVHLEDFWLNTSKFGVRRAQPYAASAWLHRELLRVIDDLPRVIALSEEVSDEDVDIILRTVIHEAEVAHYTPLKHYRCSVRVEYELIDGTGNSLWQNSLSAAATRSKPFTLEGYQHSPISPLVEETFGDTLQVLVDHNPFMIALRQASRLRLGKK